MMRRIAPCAGVLWGVGFLVLASACGSDALLGPGAPQGISGKVLIGPQCPVQSLANPCPDLPYEASIDVRVLGGERIARLRSDAEGIFRIGLRPGSYTLQPESGDPFPIAQAQNVDVRAGEYSEVTIYFDTGIR